MFPPADELSGLDALPVADRTLKERGALQGKPSEAVEGDTEA